MAQEIEAVFENGVLRPVTPLPLDERERVTLQIARKCEEDWLGRKSCHNAWAVWRQFSLDRPGASHYQRLAVQWMMQSTRIEASINSELLLRYQPAICRYYHPEPGSSVVESLVLTPDATHVLSWLTVLEATSAFALKVRTGEISVADFHLLQSRLKADLAISRFVVARVLRRHFDGTRQLLLKYGPREATAFARRDSLGNCLGFVVAGANRHARLRGFHCY